MKTPPRITHRSPGFTLIEVMVGMAILVMMVTLMAGMISSVSTAWTASRDKMDSFSKGRALMNALQNEIRGAIVRQDLASFPSNSSLSSLANDPKPLAFYTPTVAQDQDTLAQAPLDARPLTYVTYVRKDAANSRPVLVRVDRPFFYQKGSIMDSPTWTANTAAANVDPSYPSSSLLTRQLCEGVYGFWYAFIQRDGTADSVFSRNAANPTVAVQVSILVVGEQGEEILTQRGLRGTLEDAIKLAPPSGTAGWSPKNLWDKAVLENGALNSFPPQVTSAIRTYERVIPLQTYKTGT